MLYIYHLECKKGCDIDYTIETDDKNYITKNKPICPKCGRRIYENLDKTELLILKVKKKKESEEDSLKRREKYRKSIDKRRKRK